MNGFSHPKSDPFLSLKYLGSKNQPRYKIWEPKDFWLNLPWIYRQIDGLSPSWVGQRTHDFSVKLVFRSKTHLQYDLQEVEVEPMQKMASVKNERNLMNFLWGFARNVAIFKPENCGFFRVQKVEITHTQWCK